MSRSGSRERSRSKFNANQWRLTEELHETSRLMRLANQLVILFLGDHHHAVLALPSDTLRPLGRARRNTSLNRALALCTCQIRRHAFTLAVGIRPAAVLGFLVNFAIRIASL